MDNEILVVTTYDEEGNLAETKEIEIPLDADRTARKQAIATYKRERANSQAGNLSMVKLRDRINALEAVIATLVPDLDEDE